jgi:NTE family protein
MNRRHVAARRRALLAAPALLTTGCAWLPSVLPTSHPPVIHAPRAGPLAKPPGGSSLALVLSGGSARGFAHVGVLAALERGGVRPDLLVGASAGALVAALYASGMGAGRLLAISGEADASLLRDADWMRVLRLRALGVVAGNALHRFVAARIGDRRLEEMAIPLAVVATDLSTGAAVPFTQGDAAHAVHASCAIPGVFEPVEVAGRLHVDGGLSSPLPVDIARRLGARHVVAVDVVYPPTESAPPASPVDVLFQTYLVQTYRLKEHEIGRADLVIRPPIAPTAGQLGIADRATLIAAGEAATVETLPRLRELK